MLLLLCLSLVIHVCCPLPTIYVLLTGWRANVGLMMAVRVFCIY